MGKARSSLTSNGAHHSDPTSCQPGSVLPCPEVPKVKFSRRGWGGCPTQPFSSNLPTLLICPQLTVWSKVNKSSPWSIPELQPILPRPRNQPRGVVTRGGTLTASLQGRLQARSQQESQKPQDLGLHQPFPSEDPSARIHGLTRKPDIRSFHVRSWTFLDPLWGPRVLCRCRQQRRVSQDIHTLPPTQMCVHVHRHA